MALKQQDIICIIGTGSSLTSLVAGVLQRCGLVLEPEMGSRVAESDDFFGHHNHTTFVQFQDRLLAHLGGSWDTPPELAEEWEFDPGLEKFVQDAQIIIRSYKDIPAWGWHDSQTTLLLPFWQSLLPGLRYIICVDNPVAAARPLAQQKRIPIRQGVKLWNQYTHLALQYTSGASRLFAFHEDYIQDPISEIKRLVEFCHLPMPDDLDGVQTFISNEVEFPTSETNELLHEARVNAEDKLLYLGLRTLTTEGLSEMPGDANRELLISNQIDRFSRQFDGQTAIRSSASKIQKPIPARSVAASESPALSPKTQPAPLQPTTRNFDREILELRESLNQKDIQLRNLQNALHSQQTIQESVYASLGWKVLVGYWRLMDRLLPADSGRRALVERVLRLRTNNDLKKNNHEQESTNLIERPSSPPLLEPVIDTGAIADEDVKISVIIPTKNAGAEFRQLLAVLRSQRGFQPDLEIIIVDSGSTDDTVPMAEEFGAMVINILPEEFSHAYSRNLGAERATGDYLLFTVQDALPSSPWWLHELFRFFKRNEVVAVSCAEFPREDADFFFRFMLWGHCRFMEVDNQDRILAYPLEENFLNLRKNSTITDVACLISAPIFKKFKFGKVYAEDLDLGLRLIRAGYRLALLSSTRIIHSHNRPAYYYLKRAYVEGLIFAELFPEYPPPVIEAERLLPDILLSYARIKDILDMELSQISTPCTVQQFVGVLTETFQATIGGPSLASIYIAHNPHIDSEFQSFLQNLQENIISLDNVFTLSSDENNQSNGKTSKFQNLALVEATQNFANETIFGYMSGAYEFIDETVIEDFKDGLYKAFAFLCGIYLAATYWRYVEQPPESLKIMLADLTKGV